MRDEEIIGIVTSQMTSAPAVWEDGARSPDKVGKLLIHLRRQGGYPSALSWLKENDTDLAAAAGIIGQSLGSSPRRRDEAWSAVLGNLDSFAEGKGEFALVGKHEATRALGEIVGAMKATGRIETKRKKAIR